MDGGFDLHQVPTTLEAAAQLMAAGRHEDCEAVLGKLRGELQTGAAQAFRTALVRINAGDIRTGEEALVTGLIMRRRFAALVPDWPIDPAEYLAQLSMIYLARGFEVAAAGALAMTEPGYRSYYEPSETCTIPVLDAIYRHVFDCRSDGVFVEVGAFDGEEYSNTSCLADLGWRGLYIEPVPFHAELCRARHARNPAVTVEAVAIGQSNGTMELAIAGSLTRPVGDGGIVQGDIIAVPRRRLDDVLVERGMDPGFDLVVVDVEGHEADVFEGFSLDRWRPRMMIVETTDHPASLALAAQIGRAGYSALYRDFVNTVFVSAIG